MKIVGHVFRLSAFLLNGLVAVGFLICAYSPYISPVHFLLGWGALTTYLPWQFTKADEPKGEVIKVLTYNTFGYASRKR